MGAAHPLQPQCESAYGICAEKGGPPLERVSSTHERVAVLPRNGIPHLRERFRTFLQENARKFPKKHLVTADPSEHDGGVNGLCHFVYRSVNGRG